MDLSSEASVLLLLLLEKLLADVHSLYSASSVTAAVQKVQFALLLGSSEFAKLCWKNKLMHSDGVVFLL